MMVRKIHLEDKMEEQDHSPLRKEQYDEEGYRLYPHRRSFSVTRLVRISRKRFWRV